MSKRGSTARDTGGSGDETPSGRGRGAPGAPAGRRRGSSGGRRSERREPGSAAAAPPAPRPLKIAVLTIGTRGDVQPFIALGVELRARGHDVLVVTSDDYVPAVEAHGVKAASCGLASVHQPPEWLTATTFSVVLDTTTRQFLSYFDTLSRGWLERCEEYQPDALLVMSLSMPFGKHLAEKLSCACWSTTFFPALPSYSYAPAGFTNSRFGWVNAAKHVIAIGNMLWSTRNTLIPVFKKWRKEELGLRLLPFKEEVDGFKFVDLLACSEALFPRDRMWGDNVIQTGAWFLGGDAVGQTLHGTGSASGKAQVNAPYTPSPKLARFLEDVEAAAGESAPVWERRPVAVNFGSMSAGGEITRSIIARIVKAVVGAGYSCLLVTGEHDFEDTEENFIEEVEALPGAPSSAPALFCLRSAPHDWLFPRCSCVVYHGGAGTSARVVLSGVPGIVVPLLRWSDQPQFGAALERHGCGVMVQRNGLLPDEDALVAALRYCATEERHAAAAAMSRRLAAEDGVAAAADAITNCLCERLAPASLADVRFCLKHCIVCRAVEHEGGRAPYRDLEARFVEQESKLASVKRRSMVVTLLMFVLLAIAWWTFPQ